MATLLVCNTSTGETPSFSMDVKDTHLKSNLQKHNVDEKKKKARLPTNIILCLSKFSKIYKTVKCKMSSMVKDKKTMNKQHQFEYIDENFCQENKIPIMCVLLKTVQLQNLIDLKGTTLSELVTFIFLLKLNASSLKVIQDITEMILTIN